MIKIKIEDVIQKFKDYGLELLEYNYKDNRTPLKCSNSEGYLGQVCYASLRGESPYIFSEFDKRNPYSIENVRKYIKDNNIKLTLLSGKMLGGDKPLLFKCECGEEFYTTLDGVRFKNKTMCNVCANKSRGDSQRFSILDVKKQCSKYGFKVLGKYYGALVPMLVKNKEGYIGEITLANIKSNKNFAIFSPKFIAQNLNTFIKNHNEDLEIISIDSFLARRDNPHIVCKCSCGKIFKMRLESLLTFNKFRCNACTRKVSNYENLVEKQLELNYIKYEPQKRFYVDDFQKYSFDFYVESMNLVIEVDGQGHYYPVRFNGISEEIAIENFKKTRERDIEKNKFCKKHKINIIRISYLDILNDRYISILENLTHKI